MSYKIPQFNLDVTDCIDKEASEGYCNKWRKIACKKSGEQVVIWIKAGALEWSNSFDHQSLGEVLYYQLAKDLGMANDVLQYKPCIINLKDSFGKDISIIGCYSNEMNDKDEEVITLDKLDLDNYEHDSNKETYINFIKEVCKCTGLEINEFRNYLDKTILLDTISLNTDRRLGNLAVIRNKRTGKYRIAPIFDSGQSFLFMDSLINLYKEWDDFIIVNNNISTKLFLKTDFKFHEENLKLTQYYTTKEGAIKLKELSNCKFNNVISTIKILYEFLGYGHDKNWNDMKIKEVNSKRSKLQSPILLEERDVIIQLIKNRAEVTFGKRKPDFIPNRLTEYDKQTYSCFLN